MIKTSSLQWCPKPQILPQMSHPLSTWSSSFIMNSSSMYSKKKNKYKVKSRFGNLVKQTSMLIKNVYQILPFFVVNWFDMPLLENETSFKNSKNACESKKVSYVNERF